MKNIYALLLGLMLSVSTAYSQTAGELNEKAKSLIQRQDFTNAVPLLKRAANLGSAESQYNLAICLLEGTGLPKDQKQGQEWLFKSARQNFADAQFALASGYANARGSERDYNQAFYWCLKAAENGSDEAQFILTGLYATGQGTEKNLDRMLYWAKILAGGKQPTDQAKRERMTTARHNLALIYLNGFESIKPDTAESYLWFLLTNESKRDFPVVNQKEMIRQVTELQSKLSEKEQTEARKKAEAIAGGPLSNYANLLKEDL